MPFTLFSGGELSGKYFVTVQNSGARHSFCNISFSYFYMWHCGTFSEQSWPTIGNLLDRRLVQYFCTRTTVTRYLVYYMNRIWTLLFLDERNPKEYQRAFSLEMHDEKRLTYANRSICCFKEHANRIFNYNFIGTVEWTSSLSSLASLSFPSRQSPPPVRIARSSS